MKVGKDSYGFCGWSLPKTFGKSDSICIVVEKLTKFAHFSLVWIEYNAQQLAQVNGKEIVRLHGVPIFIILDYGT